MVIGLCLLLDSPGLVCGRFWLASASGQVRYFLTAAVPFKE